jgi:hypothetical protein
MRTGSQTASREWELGVKQRQENGNWEANSVKRMGTGRQTASREWELGVKQRQENGNATACNEVPRITAFSVECKDRRVQGRFVKWVD